MATKLKPVDVVTVGVGLTGTILAKGLADTGLKVVGIERGRWRDTDPDFAMPGAHDELKYVRRHELMQDLSKETLTFRNAMSETALPMRQLGSFLPGEGVGGAAVHWGGLTWRFLPWDFETKSKTLARYGANHVAEDCTLQDWGVTYDARAALQPLRIPLRRLGQSRKPERQDHPWRQSFRGRALKGISEPAPEDRVFERALRQSRAVDGLQALPRADRRELARLQERVRRDDPGLRVLRVLPVLRLRDGRESQSPDSGAARTHEEPELRAAHAVQCREDQPRLGEEASGERHLRRLARARVRAAG